jgi:hypothetical protein
MKVLKYTSIIVGFLTTVSYGYLYLSDVEVTKVTLKCKTLETIFSNQDENELLYYKITKHLFTDEPTKLLISNPNEGVKDLLPYIIGYIESSPLVKDIKFEKKHYSHMYYTFISHQRNDIGLNSPSYILSISYLNRENLLMESYIDENQKTLLSKEQCEVTKEKEFDDDWGKKVENIKKKLKI